MLGPDKITKIKDSLLYKVIYIIKNLESDEKSIDDLYEDTHRYYSDFFEFVDAISILWLVDLIELDFKKGCVRYAKEH